MARIVGRLIGLCLIVLGAVSAIAQTDGPPVASSTASLSIGSDSVRASLAQVRRELESLKQAEENERARAQKDEAIIQRLQARLDAIQSQSSKQTQTTNHSEISYTKAAQRYSRPNARQFRRNPQLPIATQFAEAMDQYFGHISLPSVAPRQATFIYDRQSNTNTFSLRFEPSAHRSWLLFDGTVEAALPNGSARIFNCPSLRRRFSLMTIWRLMRASSINLWRLVRGPESVLGEPFRHRPLAVWGRSKCIPPPISAYSYAVDCNGARWARIPITRYGWPMGPASIRRCRGRWSEQRSIRSTISV